MTEEQQTANRAKTYVNQTYEEGTLTYKGVGYNFKFKQHFAQYEYILNGITQSASIEFFKDGSVSDGYQERLNMQFYDDRSADLKMHIAAALQFEPFTVYASRDEQELHITRYELDDVFNHLSYDRPRQLQAAERRLTESKKYDHLQDLAGAIRSLSSDCCEHDRSERYKANRNLGSYVQ